LVNIKCGITNISLQKKDGGVKMQNIVSYVVPSGFLGSILNWLVIEKKITEIFDYKKEALIKTFG
jgi:hypothetical protein